MKQIVIATDGSTAARAAVDAGIALAAAQGSPVRIVHVLASPEWESHGEWETHGEPRRPLSAEEEHALNRALAHAAERGVAAELDLIPPEGSTAETIAAYGERVDAGVIVVGSRGRSGLGAAVLGSVSQGVIRHANRPVLVVPAGAG